MFHFVNDGVDAALRRARTAAADRDVRIGGGADTIAQKDAARSSPSVLPVAYLPAP